MAQDGSALNPWQVASVADLQNVGHKDDTGSDWSDGLDDNGVVTDKYDSWAMDDYYIQTADIDLDSGTFTPIGYQSGLDKINFVGNYDGDNYKIYNGSINKSSDQYIGIFAFVWNGTISNLGSEVNVIGNKYVGSIAGGNYGGTIQNCYATGSVNGGEDIGGLVGHNNGSLATIQNCYATGNVSCNINGGGLIGRNTEATIQNCYATGNVSVISSVAGGLVGKNYQGIIKYCYSLGKPFGDGTDKGGFCGSKDTGGDYEDTENYWDTETSEIATSVMGTGKTTSQMQDIDTFVGNWDMVTKCGYIDEDWYIDNGNDYPKLGWEFVVSVPIVTTNNMSNVSSTTATANADICLGGSLCSERGFEYGLTKVATWSVKDDVGGYGAGVFSKGLTDLSANTTYWIRAYAVNSIGTGYSEWLQFQTAAAGIIPTGTLINICSDYSGYTYKLMRSETDDGETYTAYFVISTDLANKQGLSFYKRILDMDLYFNNEDSGTATISVKRDNETSWVSLGSVSLAGDDDIIIKHLAVDVRAKHFLFKISASNHFEFLGVLFQFIPAGMR